MTVQIYSVMVPPSGMGVLVSNYPEDSVVEEENVPHFSKMSGDKMRAPNGPSNVFRILGDIWKCQQAVHNHCKNPELAFPFRTTTPSRNTALMTVMSKQAKPVHAHALPLQILHGVDLQHQVHMSISHHSRF